MGIQRTPLAFTTGRGSHMPITSGAANSIGIRPPAIANLVELQTLGISNDNFTVTCPKLAAGATADVDYTYNPAGLPVSFSLVNGASGIVYANLFVPTLPADGMGNPIGIIGISQSLSFAIGNAPNPGSTYWQLTARTQYQAASIIGSVRFFSPAGNNQAQVTLVGFAEILCKPPTVS